MNRIRKVYLLMLVLAIAQSGFARAEETGILFVRYPAPSPDAKTIAFSFQGDLWQVPSGGGKAVRLTVHEAYEGYPVWSPDGSEIAFSSDRFGNDDIYVIPAGGGVAQRLTFFSGGDRMCDWLPDGETVVFASNRDFYYGRMPVLYKVGRQGGTPVKLAALYANEGKISPDGRRLVFTRGRYGWERKRYRGTSSTDLWLYDFTTEEIKRLTTHEGNDRCPMWAPDGDKIFYLTDEDGIFNIWEMDIETLEKKQITHHQTDGVRFPSISGDGNLIAYEHLFDIWAVDPLEGTPQKIKITAPTDEKINLVEWKTFTNQATDMAVSPDEKEIAFVVRGEVFAMKNKEKAGKAMRITDTPDRESEIVWSPNGDTLIYVSDRNGNRDLFMVTPADTTQGKLHKALKTKTIQLTQSEEEESDPQFSPDGKKLAYIHGLGDIMIRDMKTGRTRTLIEGWNEPQYAWSPDGRWIAFSREDAEFNADIWIIPAEGGEAVNITQNPDQDIRPVWSQDGRKLGFISDQIANNNDVWFVFLRQEDEEKTREDLEEENDDKKKKDEKVHVRIDFEDIHLRVRRTTSIGSTETSLAISPDGETFAFVADVKGERDLWAVKWDGTELKQITKGGQSPSRIQWSKDGKTLTYLSKGRFRAVSPEGKNGKSLAFSARMDIDHRAERLQKFDEGWRTLYRRFYDPDFHGADWEAMKTKYRPVAAEQATLREFNNVVSLMIGELNASHLSIRGPAQGPRTTTGMLGLRFDESYRGNGLKVEGVMPKGPCDKENARVEPGEVLLSIDGHTIQEHTNIHELLNEKAGERVLIEVALKNRKTRRSLIVMPVTPGQFTDLEYDRWVKAKRAKVEE